MKLLMYVENDLVEALTVNYAKVSLPGYLSSRVRGLKEKHAPLLASSGSDAEFFVHYLTRHGAMPSGHPGVGGRPAEPDSGQVG